MHVAKSHAEDGQAHYVHESEMEKFLEGSGDVLPQKFEHIKQPLRVGFPPLLC